MTWQRHPHTIARQVPGGWLVLASGADEPVLLTGSAASLWELLDAPAELPAIVEALVETYVESSDHATRDQGTRDEISQDVEMALAELTARGVASGGAP